MWMLGKAHTVLKNVQYSEWIVFMSTKINVSIKAVSMLLKEILSE